MSEKRLDVNETLLMRTAEGEEIEFSVVALLEDEDDSTSYAVLLHEPERDDEEESFIVTDAFGNLLEDEGLAQEILDDYLEQADESEEE